MKLIKCKSVLIKNNDLTTPIKDKLKTCRRSLDCGTKI